MNGFKAVRPNGTSFYDAHTRWEVGKTVKVPASRRGEVLCRPGILHFSDAPAETLVGGYWPCRLFSVSGTPVAQDGHKFGAWSLKVLAELPAWQVFGPQGVEVVALLDSIPAVVQRGADAAKDAAWDAARVADWVAARDADWVAARDAAWVADWDAAWDAARAAAWDADWDAAWDAARAAARVADWVADWDATRAAAWDAARGAAWDAARDAARAAAWDAARAAAWDAARVADWDAARVAARVAAWGAAWVAARGAATGAATALVTRDLISPEQFAALWEPWAKFGRR